MGSRILKESICTSDNLDSLSWFDEVCFYRLIVNSDDYGRMDGRSSILKARLFPLKNVTDRQVESAVQSLRTAGIVDLYYVDDRPYLQLRTWDKHQQVRTQKSKYPAPVHNQEQATDSNLSKLKSSEIICNQMKSNDCLIQYESNTNTNTNTNTNSILHGADKSASMPDETVDVVFGLPLNTGGTYPITQSMIDEWRTLYPAVDVEQECRNMIGWLNSNPSKRKTKAGLLRFANGWLSREQDSGGAKQGNRTAQTSNNVFADILRERNGG